MDTIPALMQQNKRIEQLCTEVERGDLSVVDRLCTEWQVHERLDHDYVYRLLPTALSGRAVFIARAQADQRLISRLIRQIADRAPVGDQYLTKSGLLVRLIRQHVVAEELSVLPLLMFDPIDSATSSDPLSIGLPVPPTLDSVAHR